MVFVSHTINPQQWVGLFLPKHIPVPANATIIGWRETERGTRAVSCRSCYTGWWCSEGQCTSVAGCLPGAIVAVDACHCVTGRVRRRGLPASLLCCGSEDSTFALSLPFVWQTPTCQAIIMCVVDYIIHACFTCVFLILLSELPHFSHNFNVSSCLFIQRYCLNYTIIIL